MLVSGRVIFLKAFYIEIPPSLKKNVRILEGVDPRDIPIGSLVKPDLLSQIRKLGPFY